MESQKGMACHIDEAAIVIQALAYHRHRWGSRSLMKWHTKGEHKRHTTTACYVLSLHFPTYSMSWLKRQFRKLGLKRRTTDPPEDTLKALIQVLMNIIGVKLC